MFGKNSNRLPELIPLYVNGVLVNYESSLKYLGFHIVAGVHFSFSVSEDLKKFYRAANSVLGVLSKPSEHILMNLLYTNCVPILIYGCNVKVLSGNDMGHCNTAVNNCIRHIFS